VSENEELFAAFAHHVRTPLAVVRGYAELLSKDPNGETLARAPGAILTAAEQLGPAIDDLLLALEIESGVFEPETETLDLATLVPHSNGSATTVVGDQGLLRRALAALSPDGSGMRLSAANGLATVTARPLLQSGRSLYVARLIAEFHGGELRETPDGVFLTVPLAG